VACTTGSEAGSIEGIVVAAETGEPLGGARVSIQASEAGVLTGPDGRFAISLAPGEPSARLAAWMDGYYIGGGEEYRPGERARISLTELIEGDDPNYRWMSVEATGEGENQGCAACHSRVGTDLDSTLPVDQWRADAHGTSAVNPRFLSMYLGTDLSGNQSPATRFVDNRDYGRIPLPPDTSLPYYGPGYRLDFPDSAGNCAACHTPMAAIDEPYGVDPSTVSGVAGEGIGCDFCHKIWDVRVDESSGLPDPNRPGVLSFEFRRPPDGHQFFAGPFDDVAPGEDTFSALQLESSFCAPCHFGVFWDTQIYNSYGEWLESPYADAETGKTCQGCHMPPTGASIFALPEVGGLERDPSTIAGHLMPGAADPGLLQTALTLTVDGGIEEAGVVIVVEVLNDLTGHHVPTDSPLRHVILVVEASSADGPLALVEGPVLPDWTGVGDPADGFYAELPGRVYAKVLEELWTEVTPTGAYWNPTRIVEDTRIPAMSADTSRFVFAPPSDGPIEVEARLIFRRAFIDLARQKGWDTGDVLMERERLTIPLP
jgi:mono/diheme cytochrome c family protein